MLLLIVQLMAWVAMSVTALSDIGYPFAPNADIQDRQATKESIYLWPNGKVPYLISGYTAADSDIILSGIAEFHKYTCIRFVPRTTETDYIVFSEHSSGLCWTGKWGDMRVGRLGGRQEVSLIKSKGCLRKFNVMHELMHTLGFWHEQQRADRDQYITINWNNVIADFRETAFAKHNLSTGQYQIQHLGTPYDYTSIMHYHAYSFAINTNVPTMTAKDGCSAFGNELIFSKIDTLRMNRLYNCPANSSRPLPPKIELCVDSNANCASWAAAGECTRNPGYMNGSCRKSCKVCCACKDDNTNCASWASSGECTKNPDYMYGSCKKSCQVC